MEGQAMALNWIGRRALILVGIALPVVAATTVAVSSGLIPSESAPQPQATVSEVGFIRTLSGSQARNFGINPGAINGIPQQPAPAGPPSPEAAIPAVQTAAGTQSGIISGLLKLIPALLNGVIPDIGNLIPIDIKFETNGSTYCLVLQDKAGTAGVPVINGVQVLGGLDKIITGNGKICGSLFGADGISIGADGKIVIFGIPLEGAIKLGGKTVGTGFVDSRGSVVDPSGQTAATPEVAQVGKIDVSGR
ncbi:hypothetical protein D5S17_07205 [Pseudonocardiaceae bacterium YIM PH 21723]|nr:hypothetical protein D5S17_07205 [Pseudonocardiaceae bacterium YIM PH 21723]